MIKHRVRLMLMEELLGTKSADPELVREFIASKRPEGVDEAEVEAIEGRSVDEEMDRVATVFPRDAKNRAFLYDYQVKGFFKDACSSLRRVPGSLSGGISAYKKIIDGLIFPSPREIVVVLPDGEKIGWCEWPLRAQTAKGERVALARSEAIPAGSTIEFDVILMAATAKDGKKKIDLLELLEEWLDYGALRGLGQWRNSGKGRFTYEWQQDPAATGKK